MRRYWFYVKNHIVVCKPDNFRKNHRIGLRFGKLSCSIKKIKFVNQPLLTNGSGFMHQNGFYKIKKSIFRPKYARYEKMLRSKIVHLKKIYTFDSI